MELKLAGKKQKYHFNGAYNHRIEMVLYSDKYDDAGHVVVFAIYREQLLFARHKARGLEWPGGKVEHGESPLQAVIRELQEETGGRTASIWLIGQYKVFESNEQYFVKNIYVAVVDQIAHHLTGTDTSGYQLLPLHADLTREKGLSPLVLDPVFAYVRTAVIPEST